VALGAAEKLGKDNVRVVSMPCRERFLRQKPEARAKLVPENRPCVVIEAGVSSGWEAVAGRNGIIYCLDKFGESGAYQKLQEYYGFTADAVAEKIRKNIKL